MRTTRSFNFSGEIGRAKEVFMKMELPWYSDMELGADRITGGVASVTEILLSLSKLVRVDEMRKWTKGDMEAPAYAEEYFKTAWPDANVLRKLGVHSSTSQDLYDLITSEAFSPTYQPVTTKADYDHYAALVRKRVGETRHVIDQLRHFCEYERQVYSNAASLVSIAVDDDTITSVTRSKGENLVEQYAWWIADNTANKGFPDPSLHDAVMSTIPMSKAGALADLVQGGEKMKQPFVEPLELMAEAYRTNAETLEKLDTALKQAPEMLERKYQRFSRSSGPAGVTS